MVFDKERLKKLLDEREVKDRQSLRDLLRGLTKEVIDTQYERAFPWSPRAGDHDSPSG